MSFGVAANVLAHHAILSGIFSVGVVGSSSSARKRSFSIPLQMLHSGPIYVIFQSIRLHHWPCPMGTMYQIISPIDVLPGFVAFVHLLGLATELSLVMTFLVIFLQLMKLLYHYPRKIHIPTLIPNLESL